MKEIDSAKNEIRRTIAKKIDWFIPEGQKHFDPVSVVTAVTVLFISAFLKGFIDEASNLSENIGHAAFKNLKDNILKALEDKKDPTLVNNQIEEYAKSSQNISKSLSSEKREVLINEIYDDLRNSLIQFIPEEQATIIASSVRTSVAKNILES
jgi:hypothetical protein